MINYLSGLIGPSRSTACSPSLLLDLVNCGRQIQHLMALSAHLFVISVAIAAAASAQELSGEICLYTGIRKANEMVFSFSIQLNTIPRKTQQGYLRMLINEEVTSGLYLPWLRPTELFPPVSASSYIFCS